MKTASKWMMHGCIAALLHGVSALALAQEIVPTGQQITPTAAPGSSFNQLNPGLADFPAFTVGQLVSTVVSPDGRTLLVLSSGYNRNYDSNGSTIAADSKEYVFVFDIKFGTPVQKQVIQVPNTYSGIVFTPDNKHFYVSGGKDDVIYTYAESKGSWALSGTPIALGHTTTPGISPTNVPPAAAGLAVTSNSNLLIVANYENDSITVVDTRTSAKSELDLRPGKIDPAQSGVPGGEFPYWVVAKGNSLAYVSSIRDREIVVVKLGTTPSVLTRIPVEGNPNRMILNKAQSRLFVAVDNTDEVVIIDTATNKILQKVKTAAPFDLVGGSVPPGAGPNSLALSPDEGTLYVTNGSTNSLAVISLVGTPRVTGLIPTGFYPTSVSVSKDGSKLYVVNGKSNTGPNPLRCRPVKLNLATDCTAELQTSAGNEYDLQLTKGALLTLPVPSLKELVSLTDQVAKNNGFALKLSDHDMVLLDELRAKIKHVIYIVKENRTYDQILGDLPQGNGDPTLTQFPQSVTPNLHSIATHFVTLDNFRDSSGVSYDGWQWSTAGRTVDSTEKSVDVNYAGRGVSYDSEGTDRNINVAYQIGAQREAANLVNPTDPDILPGPRNEEDIDGPNGEQGEGYLWDNALRAGLSVRNYGFHCDLVRYSLPASEGGIPVIENPYTTGTQVAFPAHVATIPITDLYFRSFDTAMPDFFRYQEWVREFDGFVAGNNLPNLTFLRLMNDHTGSSSTAIRGVNTPELQVADNDYAVGLVLEKLAHSPYAKDTLVFVIEDDAQDGPDHVDAHRSIAFVAGPYVKQGAVISEAYTTVSMIRTIEEVLGLPTQNLHDAGVRPMVEVFDPKQEHWTFKAKPSNYLLSTRLPFWEVVPPKGNGHASLPLPLHDAQWWEKKTKNFTFAEEDRNDAAAYNRVLWEGTMGGKPYPTNRSGLDLSQNREQLLKAAGFDYSKPEQADNVE
jgi:DNA-binding beta-propeller fold protein YncE